MQKHFGVVVGVTMIGVAAVVVSQTGIMSSSSMRGQLVADYPNSTSSSSETDASVQSSSFQKSCDELRKIFDERVEICSKERDKLNEIKTASLKTCEDSCWTNACTIDCILTYSNTGDAISENYKICMIAIENDSDYRRCGFNIYYSNQESSISSSSQSQASAEDSSSYSSSQY